MSVLLLGAGGFLGLNTVDALLAEGIKFTCGRRKRSNVLGLRQRNVPMVVADLDQPATLRAAMRGCDTVVHLAGHYPRLSTEPQRSLQLGTEQIRAVLDAAATAGVERLIYVSSTATVAPRRDRPSDEADIFSTSPHFGAYHALKWAMEQQVADERRFSTTTLCPGACLGPYDWKAGTSAILWQLRAGHCPPHPDGIVSWVDVRDVALAIARLLRSNFSSSRLLLSAQSAGFHDFVQLAASRYNVVAVAQALTAEAAIALADAEEQRSAREGGRPRISRELVDLIIHGARLDGSRAKGLLGLGYRPLHEALDAFDAWAQRLGVTPSTRSEVHVQ